MKLEYKGRLNVNGYYDGYLYIMESSEDDAGLDDVLADLEPFDGRQVKITVEILDEE